MTLTIFYHDDTMIIILLTKLSYNSIVYFLKLTINYQFDKSYYIDLIICIDYF